MRNEAFATTSDQHFHAEMQRRSRKSTSRITTNGRTRTSVRRVWWGRFRCGSRYRRRRCRHRWTWSRPRWLLGRNRRTRSRCRSWLYTHRAIRDAYKDEENPAENCDYKELSNTGENAHNSVGKVTSRSFERRIVMTSGFQASKKFARKSTARTGVEWPCRAPLTFDKASLCCAGKGNKNQARCQELS